MVLKGVGLECKGIIKDNLSKDTKNMKRRRDGFRVKSLLGIG